MSLTQIYNGSSARAKFWVYEKLPKCFVWGAQLIIGQDTYGQSKCFNIESNIRIIACTGYRWKTSSQKWSTALP